MLYHVQEWTLDGSNIGGYDRKGKLQCLTTLTSGFVYDGTMILLLTKIDLLLVFQLYLKKYDGWEFDCVIYRRPSRFVDHAEK